MNIRRWFRRQRHLIAHTSTCVWGRRRTPAPDGNRFTCGTGIFICFRGTGLVLTCEHVLEPIDDDVMLTVARLTQTRQRVVARRFCSKGLDIGIAVLGDGFEIGDRCFIDASDVLTQRLSPEEAVIVYGFPLGSKALQQGAVVYESTREAYFTSTTYLSLTGVMKRNAALGLNVPTVGWAPRQHVDMNFQPFSMIGFDRHGFSGGPVFHAGSRRLVGHVTHVEPDTNGSFLCIPIDRTLEFIDKNL